MDQMKIGKFILTLRKEQGLTQAQLAEKLSVTDRAVSKWENGRGLPDISLITPLCEALGISVGELLSGERIEAEEILPRTEATIISTLDYSRRKVLRTRGALLAVLASVVAIFLLVGSMFVIDMNRMRDNLPVVFSTWGYDYAPPEDFHDEEIRLAIKKYLVDKGDSEVVKYGYNKDSKTFVAMKVYLIEELEGGECFNVYALVREDKYYREGSAVVHDGGSSVPYRFTVSMEDAVGGGAVFSVSQAVCPRDGSLYGTDIKMLFPVSVQADLGLLYYDDTIQRLDMEIKEQVDLYFSTEN